MYILHAALDHLLIYPHICRIPQIRMTSARHRVGRYTARWDEELFPDRPPSLDRPPGTASMLTTPSPMAVLLAGAGGEPGRRRQMVDDLVGVSLPELQFDAAAARLQPCNGLSGPSLI